MTDAVTRARPHAQAGGGWRLETSLPDGAAANAFLRALEVRGLSPRTVRAYALDLVVLFRRLTTRKRQVGDLSEREMIESPVGDAPP